MCSLLVQNKSGKSALAKLLTGEYVPATGSISKAVGLQIGCLSQESIRVLDQHSHETPLRYIESCNEANPRDHSDRSEKDIEAHLKVFGMSSKHAQDTLIGKLDANSRAQLALAATFWRNPQIVVLDEPSVFVDGEVLATLRQAIEDFKGGVVILSHSKHREVYENIATEKMSIRGGKVHIDAGPPQRQPVLTKAEAGSTIRELEQRLREVLASKSPNESEMHDMFNKLQQLKAGLNK